MLIVLLFVTVENWELCDRSDVMEQVLMSFPQWSSGRIKGGVTALYTFFYSMCNYMCLQGTYQRMYW